MSKSWLDRAGPYLFVAGILLSTLLMGYGPACKYVIARPVLWSYMMDHGIPFPHVWLARQFDRLHLPIREAAAQSGGGSPEHIVYLHTDASGRVIATSTQDGEFRRVPPAEPFGKPQGPDPEPINFGFPGQYYDRETGLYYNNRRDYAPSIGRYAQPDPIADQVSARLVPPDLPKLLSPSAAGVSAIYAPARRAWVADALSAEAALQPYGYAGGNPITRIDPQGLQSYNAAVLAAIATGRLWEAAELIEDAGGSPAAVEALRRANLLLQNASQAAGECQNVAQRLYDEFKTAGLNPRFVQLTSSGTGRVGNIISKATGQGISTTGYHVAVLIENRAYDAFTGPAGMPLDQYSGLFESLGPLAVRIADSM